MRGKPLAEARRCAEFVVSRLAATDVLALVQFDNRVERLWPAVPLRDGSSVRAAIERIEAGGGNHYYGDTADDLMEPFERELDLIARLVLRRLVLRVHAADGVQVSMVNILERSLGGGWRLADLAAGAEAWALLSVRVAADRVMDVGTLAQVLTVEVSGQLPDGAPAAIPSASLQLPVLTAAAFRSLAEDELVVRRRLELKAAETLARIRELVAEGNWDQVESLLVCSQEPITQSPAWCGALGVP
jgi:Ca-activated chloride channel family protein